MPYFPPIRKNVFCNFVLCCLLFFSQHVEALDFTTKNLRISGFGTLGVTYAGNDAFGVQKDYIHSPQFGNVTVLTDSVFGIQIDYSLLKNLNATIQAVAEDRARQDFNNIVDWAYLTYQPTNNTVVRAGRLGVDLFMLSEYRNVGFAYLWSHPVVEFYKQISLSHFEGMDFKYSRRIKPGYFEFKVYGGQTGSDLKITSGDLKLRMRPFAGMNISLETDHWRYRLTYATTHTSKLQNPFNTLIGALRQTPSAVWPSA